MTKRQNGNGVFQDAFSEYSCLWYCISDTEVHLEKQRTDLLRLKTAPNSSCLRQISGHKRVHVYVHDQSCCGAPHSYLSLRAYRTAEQWDSHAEGASTAALQFRSRVYFSSKSPDHLDLHHALVCKLTSITCSSGIGFSAAVLRLHWGTLLVLLAQMLLAQSPIVLQTIAFHPVTSYRALRFHWKQTLLACQTVRSILIHTTECLLVAQNGLVK